MTIVHRVHFPKPITSLEDYERRRGGRGLLAAGDLSPAGVLAMVADAGLRGRGGAGFPTAVKWQTTIDNTPAGVAPTLVVNGAEGEPGTFKDRTILRIDPYVVLEGALIAAFAVGAGAIVVALKASASQELDRVHTAIAEMQAAGWVDDVPVAVVEGPDEYLFGEETALLEVIDGRFPLPRIQPPYRRGVSEVWVQGARIDRSSGLSAAVELAAPGGGTGVAPALVDNVETLANVPGIIGRGAQWFRSLGTAESPGTIVCTVSGSTLRDDVGEVPMGTPLRAVLDEIGGGLPRGRRVKAVLAGVSNPVLTEEHLDTPLSYEDMLAVGAGLGTGGYLVYDDRVDMVALAAGVARFLAVESCGQCSPCKQDGLAIAGHLARLARNEGDSHDLDAVREELGTVADGARCYLATQQQKLVTSLVDRFPDEFEAHAARTAGAVEPLLVAELVDIDGYEAVVDEQFSDKQPDWTHAGRWGGQLPAERLGEHRTPR
jgi:NADH-quinone oxidoreductase subunit F